MKKMNYIIVCIILAVAIAGCAGQSRHHKAPMPEPASFNAHFGDMDTNGVGEVSWDEFKTHFPQATPEIYKELDLDGDGRVDHDEWHEFKEAHELKHIE